MAPPLTPLRPGPPPRCLALCPQLFNIYPWLGTLLQLHRPVLRKIEEVRAILRTLLEARRPSMPRRGPVQSYMDALIQEGQVWVRRPQEDWGWGGVHASPAPCSSTSWLGASLSLSLLICETGHSHSAASGSSWEVSVSPECSQRPAGPGSVLPALSPPSTLFSSLGSS